MSQGKVVIVTGANCGIGYEATRLLCREAGTEVIMACRSQERTETALKKLKNEIPEAKAEYKQLDLSNLESIRSFAEDFLQSGRPLDALVNNAGVFLTQPERMTTEDGIELTFGTNYIGPFLLTHLLLPALKKTAESKGEARIVVVVSSLHDVKIASMNGRRKVTYLDPDDFELVKDDAYSGYQAYKNSKAADVMFSYSMDRMLEGSGITVNAVCPGFIPGTQLGRHANALTRFVMNWILDGVMKPFRKITRSPQEGGASIYRLAMNPELKGVTGEYFARDEKKESSEESHDLDLQEKIWNYATNITKVEANFPRSSEQVKQ